MDAWPVIIPFKPTLTTTLASTMMIAVCAVVTTALAAVALAKCNELRLDSND